MKHPIWKGSGAKRAPWQHPKGGSHTRAERLHLCEYCLPRMVLNSSLLPSSKGPHLQVCYCT